MDQCDRRPSFNACLGPREREWWRIARLQRWFHYFIHDVFEFSSSDRGDFWASPVEILMFARVTGCMLTSAGFDFIHLEHILKNTLKRAVIFLQSKTKGHFTHEPRAVTL